MTYDITKAPSGTTHVLPPNPLDFDRRPIWLKWGYAFTGPESGRRFYQWYSWDRGEWRADKSFHPRENTVLLKLAEFQLFQIDVI